MVDKKTNVLIVDDEAVVCDLLNNELSEQGYLCTIAFNGNEAVNKLTTQDFDIVLLDIKLPGVSGMEVLRIIRSRKLNTAVIMITGVNDVDTAVDAMKLGALDYIVKPFGLDKLNSAIYNVLVRSKRSPEMGDNKTVEESANRMNAIARGVEARLDLVDRHPDMIIQITVDTAQQLGIPDREIEEWLLSRLTQENEKEKVIKSCLNKLRSSPLAQYILGMTEAHRYKPRSNHSRN